MPNNAETQRKANKLMGMLNPDDPMEKVYSIIRDVGLGFNKVKQGKQKFQQAKIEDEKKMQEATKPKQWDIVPSGNAVPMPTATKKDNVKTSFSKKGLKTKDI